MQTKATHHYIKLCLQQNLQKEIHPGEDSEFFQGANAAFPRRDSSKGQEEMLRDRVAIVFFCLAIPLNGSFHYLIMTQLSSGQAQAKKKHLVSGSFYANANNDRINVYTRLQQFKNTS